MKYSKNINKLPLKKKLLEQYGASCYFCKTKFVYYNDVHIDHLIPQIEKGSHYIDNLRPVCVSCNSKKWRYSLEEWEELIDKEILILSSKLKKLRCIKKTLQKL